jgi:hypothetical protein
MTRESFRGMTLFLSVHSKNLLSFWNGRFFLYLGGFGMSRNYGAGQRDMGKAAGVFLRQASQHGEVSFSSASTLNVSVRPHHI